MFHKHFSYCFGGNQSFWHMSITIPLLPQHSVWKKRQSAASHTNTIDIAAEFSQTLKYGVEGGRKCFLNFLACLPKNEMKKGKKFWCYFIVWRPPPQPPVTYSLCPTPNHPPSTLTPHPATPCLQPHAFFLFYLFFIFFGGVRGWRRSVPLQAALNHQGCVHLCALITCDRWRRLVLNDAASRFFPISLRYQNGMGTWGGGLQKIGKVVPCVSTWQTLEGDASLSPACCVQWQPGCCSVTDSECGTAV